jgi:D-alanyl-D-alanine carboxypeptidase/D-alanyl-D-alanine-endopeptidase (penicillin-binding protein 4)
MNRSIISLVLFIGFSVVAVCEAQTVEQLIKKAPASQVGLVVADSNEAHFDDASLAEEELIPASTQKIITSVVALDQLGNDFRFFTHMYYEKINHKNVLMVRGGGDPTLTTEKVYEIVRKLKAQGISSVDTLLIDSTSYEEERKTTGDRAYNSTTHATSINYNSQEKVVCKNPPYECSIQYQSLKNPEAEFASIWKQVLFDLGMGAPKISFQSISTNARLVYRHLSEPLPKILFDLNHYSTNVLADSLVYALGADNKDSKDDRILFSFTRGLKRIELWLQAHNIKGVRMYDGSGLSEKNRITPKALFQTLQFAMGSIHISSEFLSSLSIGNMSGTLKTRDFNPKIFFRGKSGSLSGVISIAGIVRTVGKKDKIVVIILNGVNDPESAKRWEENLINYVYEKNS